VENDGAAVEDQARAITTITKQHETELLLKSRNQQAATLYIVTHPALCFFSRGQYDEAGILLCYNKCSRYSKVSVKALYLTPQHFIMSYINYTLYLLRCDYLRLPKINKPLVSVNKLSTLRLAK
jgi:hypothetical protein